MENTFSKAKICALVLLSVSFWLNGVFLVRFFSSHGWWGGYYGPILFLLSVPVAALCIGGVRRLLSLTHEEVLLAVVLITALVAFLHGAALLFTPMIYNSDPQSLLYASAWLIWFCGAVLLPAYHIQRKSA